MIRRLNKKKNHHRLGRQGYTVRKKNFSKRGRNKKQFGGCRPGPVYINWDSGYVYERNQGAMVVVGHVLYDDPEWRFRRPEAFPSQ